MRALLLLAMLPGCTAVHSTVCGLSLGVSPDTQRPSFLTPAMLQEAEDLMLSGMWTAADSRLANPTVLCRSFNGVRVYSMATENFDSFGRTVSGVAYCPSGRIVIGAPSGGGWRESALVHELVHIGQDCGPRLPATDGRDSDHANWDADGIQSAIDQVNAL